MNAVIHASRGRRIRRIPFANPSGSRQWVRAPRAKGLQGTHPHHPAWPPSACHTAVHAFIDRGGPGRAGCCVPPVDGKASDGDVRAV
jgi:hypothetical protein